jgi:hypothetical protein
VLEQGLLVHGELMLGHRHTITPDRTLYWHTHRFCAACCLVAGHHCAARAPSSVAHTQQKGRSCILAAALRTLGSSSNKQRGASGRPAARRHASDTKQLACLGTAAGWRDTNWCVYICSRGRIL